MTDTEDILELKAALKLSELKVQALVNILAKEGILSRDDLDKEFSSLCEGD